MSIVAVRDWKNEQMTIYTFALNEVCRMELFQLEQFIVNEFCPQHGIKFSYEGAADPEHYITVMAIRTVLEPIRAARFPKHPALRPMLLNLRQLFISNHNAQTIENKRLVAQKTLRNHQNCMENSATGMIDDPTSYTREYCPDLATLALISPYITLIRTNVQLPLPIDNCTLGEDNSFHSLIYLAEDNASSIEVLQTAICQLNKKDDQAAPQSQTLHL